MPLYDFKCDNCDHIEERFAKVNETKAKCPKCDDDMRRIISNNYSVHGDLEPYIDYDMHSKPVPIKSRKHKQRMMEKYGVAELFGNGWK